MRSLRWASRPPTARRSRGRHILPAACRYVGNADIYTDIYGCVDIYLQCVGVVVVVSRTPDPERVVTLAGSPAEAARVGNIVDIV